VADKHRKRCRMTSVGEDVERWEPWCIANGNVNGAVIPQKIKIKYHIIQQFYSIVYTPKN